MQTRNLLSITALLCDLSLPTAALAHAEHGQPQFGGDFAEAGEAQFEIVGKDGKLVVHVTNHGAPLDTVGVTGKLTGIAAIARKTQPFSRLTAVAGGARTRFTATS